METWQIALVKSLIIYSSIGFVLSFIVFILAKIKNLDEKISLWYPVLNSTTGFLYYMFLGSVVWLPIMISIRKDRKIGRKQSKKLSWWLRINYLIRSWFNEFYQ